MFGCLPEAQLSVLSTLTDLGLLRRLQPHRRTTDFTYYSDGLAKTVHSAGATTSMEYDDAGRLRMLTDPLGFSANLAYDSAGRITTATDTLGSTTSYTYDPEYNLGVVRAGPSRPPRRTSPLPFADEKPECREGHGRYR